MKKLLSLLIILSSPLCGQTITWNLNIIDSGNNYSPATESLVESNFRAALKLWNAFLEVEADRNIEIEVVLGFDAPTANGGSLTSAFVGPDPDGTGFVFEQAVSHELKTGTDPNGSAPDARITIGINYLLESNNGQFWLDSTPEDRTDESLPAGKAEAISVFLHEIGHVLGFNGFANSVDGTPLASGDRSSFGQYIVLPAVGASDQTVTFNGPRTIQLYGGPVPLTSGNLFHLGNSAASGLRGSDFAKAMDSDLMNGVVFHSNRYQISAYTLAVLEDCGVPVKVTWEQFQTFPFLQSASTQTLSPAGDLDGDGSPNLVEFGLGTDPLRATSVDQLQLRPAPPSSSSSFEISVPQIRSLRQVQLVVEEVTDLRFSTPAKTTTLTPSGATLSLGREIIEFGTSADTKRFFRLKVETTD